MSSSTMSVKDRIAAMNAQKATSAPATPSTPQPADGADSLKKRSGGSIADRIAALKEGSKPTDSLSTPVKFESPVNKSDGESNIVSETREVEEAKVDAVVESSSSTERRKSMSIAERIALMKTPPQPVTPQPPAVQRGSINKLVFATPQIMTPDPSQSSAQDVNESSSIPQSDSTKVQDTTGIAHTPIPTGSNDSAPSSIAQKIAMLKSPNPSQLVTPSTNDSTADERRATRRLSTDLKGFGASINLAGLMPGGPRPTPPRPPVPVMQDESPGKAEVISTLATDENGELQHANLTRASVPSMRRKKPVASMRLSNDWQTALQEEEGRSATPANTTTDAETTISIEITLTDAAQDMSIAENTTV